MSIGQRVKQARAERKLSLSALACSSRLSKGFISQVESGLARPSIESLRRIAEALSVSLAELIEDAPHVAHAEPLEAPVLVRHAVAFGEHSEIAHLSSMQAGVFAKIKLPPGAYLGSDEPTGIRFTCFCTVLGGGVQFSGNGSGGTLALSGGDALTWNAGEAYKLANAGDSVALLLLFVSSGGKLPTICRSDYQEVAPTPRPSRLQPVGEAHGPFKLVAMRAARTGVRTP